jgi:hypothetical protein
MEHRLARAAPIPTRPELPARLERDAHLGKSLFSKLAFRDIEGRANVAREGTARIKNWDTGIENPAIFPVIAPKAIIHAEWLAQIECLRVSI